MIGYFASTMRGLHNNNLNIIIIIMMMIIIIMIMIIMMMIMIIIIIIMMMMIIIIIIITVIIIIIIIIRTTTTIIITIIIIMMIITIIMMIIIMIIIITIIIILKMLKINPTNNTQVKTRLLRKNENPVFEEQFDFYNMEPQQVERLTLYFSVYSFDRFSRDYVIGEVRYPLAEVVDCRVGAKDNCGIKEDKDKEQYKDKDKETDKDKEDLEGSGEIIENSDHGCKSFFLQVCQDLLPQSNKVVIYGCVYICFLRVCMCVCVCVCAFA